MNNFVIDPNEAYSGLANNHKHDGSPADDRLHTVENARLLVFKALEYVSYDSQPYVEQTYSGSAEHYRSIGHQIIDAAPQLQPEDVVKPIINSMVNQDQASIDRANQARQAAEMARSSDDAVDFTFYFEEMDAAA